MSRSVIQVTPQVDPWPIVDDWAARTGYGIASHGDWGRAYTRGDGFWTPTSHVQVFVEGGGLRIEAWVIFWITGGEYNLGRGFVQALPRRQTRKLVNPLLAALGAPPIS